MKKPFRGFTLNRRGTKRKTKGKPPTMHDTFEITRDDGHAVIAALRVYTRHLRREARAFEQENMPEDAELVTKMADSLDAVRIRIQLAMNLSLTSIVQGIVSAAETNTSLRVDGFDEDGRRSASVGRKSGDTQGDA